MGIKFQDVKYIYQGASKKDRTVALENINLDINEKDEIIAICGKTGSGKTTLIQHLNALLLPTEGSVTIFNQKIVRKNKLPLTPIRKKVGFVFQFPEYQLFEETVLKDIAFAPKNFGLSEEEAIKKAKEMCDLVGIKEDILDKSPLNLSGGQMRKVAIAGILAYEPDILVLDEPTRGLDPITAKEVMDMFLSIHKEKHKTIILISHDMDLVYKYAIRVIVLKDSHLVYNGSKEDLFKNETYQEYHLEKPTILKTIDYLNDKLGYNISYNHYDIDDLYDKLLEVDYE